MPRVACPWGGNKGKTAKGQGLREKGRCGAAKEEGTKKMGLVMGCRLSLSQWMAGHGVRCMGSMGDRWPALKAGKLVDAQLGAS